MRKRDFDLVIFDMDGTLYPPDPRMDEAYPRAALNLLERIVGLDPAQAERIFAKKHAELHRALGGRVTNTRVLLHFFEEIPFDAFAREVDGLLDIEAILEPDSRAAAVVRSVCAAFQTALYTTNNGITAARVLRHLGMEGCFPDDRRWSLCTLAELPLPRRDRLACMKPSVEGYGNILRTLGAEAERSLMVGDSELSDIRPAARLGMETYKVGTSDDLYRLPGWLGLEEPQT